MVLNGVDFSEGLNALNRTGNEISQAAKYCSVNYLKANGNQRVIDETMNYATQSLGTMIHHINQLATSFLCSLDEKTENMAEIEESVDRLALEIKIRREKIARKAIGSCTISKLPVKCTLTKVRQGPPAEYVRRPIDYSLLDHIGHGNKTQEPVTSHYSAPGMHARTLTRRGSASNQQMAIHSNTMNPKTMGIKSNVEYPAAIGPDRCQGGGGGTLGRTAGICRTGINATYAPGGMPGPQAVALPQTYQQPGHPMVGNGRGPGNPPLSVGYTSATGSLGGPSPRSSTSSGNPPRGQGYASTGQLHQQQQMFTDQRSPVRQQPSMSDYMRQQSDTTGSGGGAVSQVQHNFPPPQFVPPPTDTYKMSCHDLPAPPPLAQVPSSGDPVLLNMSIMEQQQQRLSALSNIADVDIKRLQPCPSDQLKVRQSGDPAWAPHHYIQKVMTVYEYTADKSDELTFDENVLIFVIKKNDDGWWEGVMSNGQTGLFPGNYVEVIE